MAPDAALYASIAKTMAQSNNYIELFVENTDWLDKPHFPFWISALSFEVFGINTFAYKLPALLFVFLGAVYTYLLAKKLHSKEAGLWAVFFLLTAEHIIISNNDVRAEPYLTGLIIAGVYHFYRSYAGGKNWHLLPAAFFTACAIMTKGPFVLITIGGAIGFDLLLRKQWKGLFHWRWLVALLLLAVFISPELYTLWHQFDAHPEKEVFGKTGVSGIRFFLWDSQFGRFFNTGPIKGEGDPFFFLHTTLWAFLPWGFLLFAGIYTFVRKAIVKTQMAGVEWLSLGAILPTFLVFSLSSFQLSHYLNFLFPFFAIVTAVFVAGKKRQGWIVWTQLVICLLLLAALVSVHILYKPGNTVLFIILLLSILVVIALLNRVPASKLYKALLTSGFVVLGLNVYLNLVFYPSLLRYQAGSEAAYFINRYYPQHKVYALRMSHNYALDFYLQGEKQNIENLSERERVKKPALLLLRQEERAAIPATVSLTFIRSFADFPVTRLDLEFVNAATRPARLKQYYLYLLP